MKRILSCIITVFITVGCMSFSVSKVSAATPTQMLPLKLVFVNNFKSKLIENKSTHTYTISKNTTKLVVVRGKKTAMLNGKVQNMDQPIKVNSGIDYISTKYLQKIACYFGYKIWWTGNEWTMASIPTVSNKPSTNQVASIKVAGVGLDKANVIIKVGEVIALNATVWPSNSTNKEVTWSSSNTSIAVVSNNGEIKAVGQGTVKVTVKTSDGSKTATADITVVPPILNASDISKKYGNAVVYIEALNENKKAFAAGSGFLISGDGKIITNYHVIDKAAYVFVELQDGRQFQVSSVLNYNINKDLAVLYIGNVTGLPYVKLADSDKVGIGDKCFAIGSPEGLKNTISEGIVSQKRESTSRKGFMDLQISVPISSGSSGGAVFDGEGNVIGITYAGINTSGDLNFAIPINDAKDMIDYGTGKTFAQVMKEVYPSSGNSLSTKSCDELSAKLIKDFPSFTLNGYTTNINRYYVTEVEGKVIVIVYLKGEVDYVNYLKSLLPYEKTTDEEIYANRGKWEEWVYKIYSYSYYYLKGIGANTNFGVTCFAEFSMSSKPTYDYYKVEYNSATSKYDIIDWILIDYIENDKWYVKWNPNQK